MNNSFAPSASSLEALALQYRAISDNMANGNTAGFKRTVNSFSEQLQKQMMLHPQHQPDTNEVTGIAHRDFTQGSISHTGRTLDVAIEGKGFFVVETAEGPRYTRNGTFRADERGQLVDHQGRAVAGRAGPITLPRRYAQSKVSIGLDGTISVGDRKVGELKVVEFEDETLLAPEGGSLFRTTDDKAKPIDSKTSVVHQGYRESSNVNMVEELVNLMQVTKLYDANIKAMKKQDERLGNLIQAAM